MRNKLIALGICSCLSSPTLSAGTVELDFSFYKVKPANVTKSAVYALLNRGWDVQAIEEKSVSGLLEKSGHEVLINFGDFPKVQFSIKNGGGRTSWLEGLKTDMTRNLVSCVY